MVWENKSKESKFIKVKMKEFDWNAKIKVILPYTALLYICIKSEKV